jgi:hypothetical protein
MLGHLPFFLELYYEFYFKLKSGHEVPRKFITWYLKSTLHVQVSRDQFTTLVIYNKLFNPPAPGFVFACCENIVNKIYPKAKQKG